MRRNNLKDLLHPSPATNKETDKWVMGLEAIIAINVDPEHQHRVKVIIPAIDEHEIHDKWVKRLVWWSGAPGYGDFHYPEIGSEVILLGRLGQKHNLYYISVFNEDFLVPSDFWEDEGGPTRRGFRTDGDYRTIVELDHQMRAGRFRMEADSSVEIIAPGGLFINGKKVE